MNDDFKIIDEESPRPVIEISPDGVITVNHGAGMQIKFYSNGAFKDFVLLCVKAALSMGELSKPE